MGMQIPRLGGLPATREIRMIPEASHTPIIAMTANAFADDSEQRLVAGMNDGIAKPVDPDAMLRTSLNSLGRVDLNG